MTTTETIRAAAVKLREAAEAATPGPWRQECSEMCANVVEADDDEQAVASTWAPSSLPDNDYRREEGNAAYIATVHPAFGLAVADWLDAEACAEEVAASIGVRGLMADDTILATARSVLGDEEAT